MSNAAEDVAVEEVRYCICYGVFQVVVCTACAEVIDADGMLFGLAFCTRIYSNTQLKYSLDNYLKMVAD